MSGAAGTHRFTGERYFRRRAQGRRDGGHNPVVVGLAQEGKQGFLGRRADMLAELLAGVLSGGGTIQPENPRAGLATNNLFALVFDPASAGAPAWG